MIYLTINAMTLRLLFTIILGLFYFQYNIFYELFYITVSTYFFFCNLEISVYYIINFCFQDNAARMSALVSELRDRVSRIAQGGGEKAITRHVSKGNFHSQAHCHTGFMFTQQSGISFFLFNVCI